MYNLQPPRSYLMTENPFAGLLQYAGVGGIALIEAPDCSKEGTPVRLLFTDPETGMPLVLHTHTLRRAEGLELPAPLMFKGKILTHLHFKGSLLSGLFKKEKAWTCLGVVSAPAHKATRKTQVPLVVLNDVLAAFA